jgi:hypothetical protein
MRYRSTTFGFLMRHTSTWMAWLKNKMCDFGHRRIHVWYWELQCGRCLMSWTARANFLWRDSERWVLFKHVAEYFMPHLVCRYKLSSGSCSMEPGRTQQMLFCTFCVTLSTCMSSQTDFLIISHVDRTGPPNSPDLNTCDYFLRGILKEKIFPKKLQTIMKLRALIIQV